MLNLQSQDTVSIARSLIGYFLIRRLDDDRLIKAIITETEAYDGFKDKGSHAHRGCTKRNEIMFGPSGHWYVYLIYGVYDMLNLVTGPQNYPAAVLIRGASLINSKKQIYASLNGPGKLTRFLDVKKSQFNSLPAKPSSGLWLEKGIDINLQNITAAPRVGISYAGPVWSKKPWRFTLKLSNC